MIALLPAGSSCSEPSRLLLQRWGDNGKTNLRGGRSRRRNAEVSGMDPAPLAVARYKSEGGRPASRRLQKARLLVRPLLFYFGEETLRHQSRHQKPAGAFFYARSMATGGLGNDPLHFFSKVYVRRVRNKCVFFKVLICKPPFRLQSCCFFVHFLCNSSKNVANGDTGAVTCFLLFFIF